MRPAWIRHNTLLAHRPALVLSWRAAQHENCFGKRFRTRATMFGRKEKKHSLYYLLPGMTRANREKRRRFFWWSVLVGIIMAALAGAIIYWTNLGPRP